MDAEVKSKQMDLPVRVSQKHKSHKVSTISLLEHMNEIDDGKEQDMEVDEQEVIEILKIPAEKRNRTHWSKLTNYLWKVDFFKSYVKEGNKEVVRKCAKQLMVKYYTEGKPIIIAGEIGNEFFISLRGEIGVFMCKESQFEFTFAQLLKFLIHHKGYVQRIDKRPIK
jgi:hypothetical protein